MKITPQPVTTGDKVNKARDMSGLRKWARESRSFGRMIHILGWFTIPSDVILHHGFGRRWFTPINFYAGAFLIFIVGALQYLADVSRHYVANFKAEWNPFYTEVIAPAQSYYHGTREMGISMLVYIVFGTYHLFRIWWRNRTNAEIHSYDDGTSSLDFVGRSLMGTINAIAAPLIYIYMLFTLTADERKAIGRPKLIDDEEKFTNTVAEPLFFLVGAIVDRHTIISIWFIITAFAVAVHANLREAAKRSKVLDFKDSAIEAKAMRELRKSMQQGKTDEKRGKKNKKDAPPLVPKVAIHYPDLATIIEEMNREKGQFAH